MEPWAVAGELDLGRALRPDQQGGINCSTKRSSASAPVQWPRRPGARAT